jgi:hypothetical protein
MDKSMSDTVSVSSNQSGGGGADSSPAGIVIEEVGQLALTEFVPRRLVLLNYTLAALSDDDRLILGEIRTRGGDDWTLAGRSVTTLGGRGGDDKRYVDLALVPNAQHGQGGASVIFLVEKKNKERYITAHNIKHGKILALDEELSSYDKVNVLGKGVTHIAADVNAPEPTVYSVSNLIRKLRLEDGGSTLKPTPARAVVPPEGQDGTLSVAVQPVNAGKKTSSHQATVVVAFRTKSASKNKFMIEWYSTKKDELTCMKSAVKMSEDCEPIVLLSDPKDARTVFALCRNKTAGTTALYKLTRGRKHEEPITVFNYDVELAAMGMSADQNVTLLTFEAGREVARIYTLAKSEGFRGRHPICAHCPPLEVLSSPSHVISCATHRWQMPMGLVDQLLGLKIPIGNNAGALQMGLVTLVDSNSGRYVTEPETGLPYRLRIIGCDTQGFTPLAILLEDLERTFEGAEEDKLASATVKVCLNQTPCKDSVSQLSAWLMAGRIGSIEVYYVKSPGAASPDSSDRLMMKPVSGDRFRSYLTDMDWTQMNQRQGTFTLSEDGAAAVSASSPSPSASLSSSSGRGHTKIPVVSGRGHSASPAAGGGRISIMSASCPNGGEPSPPNSGSSSLEPEPPSSENVSQLKSLVASLSERLHAAQADNEALRGNLEELECGMEEITRVVNSS